MALKPGSVKGDRFAKRWFSKSSYRRLRRDAKRAARRLRRRQGVGDAVRVVSGWL